MRELCEWSARGMDSGAKDAASRIRWWYGPRGGRKIARVRRKRSDRIADWRTLGSLSKLVGSPKGSRTIARV